MPKRSRPRPSIFSRGKTALPAFTGAAAAFALSMATIAAATPAYAAGNLKVETQEGPVKGFLVNGVAEFLGVPYAEPPVGNLRWKPSKKHGAWTSVLQAKAFGPTCAQITENALFAGPANNNEDCLYLNVFTPNVDPAAKEKLPVIFWIHGGGNIDGESNDYDGTKLAAQGHTVVVTINYRLGLLGWMAHPALDAEGHVFGDYGLSDQITALKWVKRNIGQFGGDKNNVTVGGQSAGSVDSAALVAAPLAAGLFQRGIFESKIVEPTPLPTAEAKGTAFATAAGCGSGAGAATAKCLRALTAQQILSLQGTASASGPYGNFLIADGQILPSGLLATAFKNGQFNHMPIMSGTTEDEGNFFIGVPEYFSKTPVTAASFTAYVNGAFGGNSGPGGSPPAYPAGTPNKVLARYPLYAYTTAQLAQDAVETDVIACTQRSYDQLLVGQAPIYAYEFDDRTAPFYLPPMTGFQSLAYHTSDIQYLFPLYHGAEGIVHPLNKKQEKLSDELVAAWTNFAWTGNPNGQGKSPWPPYKAKADQPSFLSENIPVLSTFTDAQFSAAHKCDLWDKIITY